MRNFLEERDAAGDNEPNGEGARKGSEGDGVRKSRIRKPSGSRIDRIVLERGKVELAIAAGCNVPLLVSCFEDNPGEDPKPVKAEGLVAKCDKPGIADFRPDSLRGLTPGVAVAWLETGDGRVSSNQILLEVLATSSVDLVGPAEPLRDRLKRDSPSALDVIQAGDVDSSESWPNGRNREEDQALPDRLD